MIVKYIGKDNVKTKLSNKKEYKILSVEAVRNSGQEENFDIKFRVLNDNGISALYDLNVFEIIDTSFDSDFVFKKYKGGGFDLMPKSMSYNSFWEDFYNYDEKALSVFKTRFPEYKDEIF